MATDSDPPNSAAAAVLATAEPLSPKEPVTGLIVTASLWERIKEHKLIQWGLAYIGAALAIAHGTELLAGTFEWPHFVGRLVMGALVLGLPVALTFAWYHGHKGLKRVSAGELLIASLLVLIGAGLLVVFVRPQAEHEQHAHVAPLAATTSAQTQTANSPRPALGDKSIAVLPFKNFSPDKSYEYFADGLTEELLNRLANVGSLKVTSRTSSFAFKDKDTPIPEIARQLGVRHVLEGSVRRDGNDLRVTAQLIDVSTDTHLWSETFDRKVDKVFAIQDEIAGKVTDALKVALLGADQQPLAPLPTTSVDLYGDYLKARQEILSYQFEPMKKAEPELRRIVAADPKFLPAATTLIDLYLRMGETGIISHTKSIELASPLVDQVLRTDDRNAEAWLDRDKILTFEHKSADAKQARERAYALAPNNPLILDSQIAWDAQSRQPAGVEKQIQTLIALDPLSVFSYISPSLWYARQSDEPRERALLKRIHELFPDNPWPLAFSIIGPMSTDTNASIIESLRRSIEVEPTDPDLRSVLAIQLLDAGAPDEAERWAKSARAIDPNHPFAAGSEALLKLYRGDTAGAERIAEPLARPKAPARWGSHEFALRILATRALAQSDTAAARNLIPIYIEAYPDLETGAVNSIAPAYVLKWAYLMAGLDLGALYQKVGDTEKASVLFDGVEADLKYWPLRGSFGTGFAEAELDAIRGNDAAALDALRRAAAGKLTYAWWFFLDHSPHFTRLRKLPEFAAIRAEFAANAAIPKSATAQP